MALNKQMVSISFGQGIDTKTDPNQVVPGKLISLSNTVFGEGMSFNKRNGYTNLSSISAGVNLSTFKNELVGFSGTNLYSYSPSTQTTINKGNISGLDISVSSVFRSSGAQTSQDSAFHSSGLYLYVWVDSANGAQYQVVSSQTGNQVIAATSLAGSAILPRAWSLGNFLIITYVDNATFHLRYISIPVLNLTQGASAPVDISTQVNTSSSFYDGAVINNGLYLSWNASDIGGAVRTTYLDRQLNQHNTVIQATENASVCIAVWGDTGTATPTVWTAYCNGGQIKYFVQNSNALSSILAATLVVGSLSGINNITGYANNGVGNIFYQTQNTYSYSTTRSDFVSQVSVSSGGSIGSPSVFLRSVGLVSKPFVYNSTYYLCLAYNGALQQTYFIVNQSGYIVAKLAYGNGGGYTAKPSLTTINPLTTAGQFQIAYLLKDQLQTQSGQVYTQTGVNSAVLDFVANDLYQTVELGSNLNVSGGFLWAYDGFGPVEQNFHLFPEDFAALPPTTASGIIGANTYSYVPLYEWLDNQGNIQRSGYGTPLSVPSTGATTGITVNIPTLRLTAKQSTRSPVNITLYRTAPSVATNIYYRVSSITAPTLNSVTSDSVTITDTSSDAQIIGNQLLYTTGGVVQDSGSPAASAMTLFKNRLFLVDAEDRNTLWYSKTTLQGTPVEMSQLFTLYVDPRFGGVTALSVMDDKLIIFKQNAIFYMAGIGPDNTGANNDFTEAVFITSVVGCTNFRSIVLTQDGLMFQSNKGIWQLGRDLSISYIGAPVEAYNSFSVTSAQLVPNTTQVRFTISSGIALVYDYFYKQWGTFSNHNAVGACIFNQLYTYLTPGGIFYQEAPGVYTDNGVPFYMGLTTSWLSFSNLQGFQRAYRMYLLSKFQSAHLLNVQIAYDFDANPTQNTLIRPSYLANPNYGSDPVYGSVVFFGGYNEEEQYRINFNRQRCQSIQITIQEALDTSNPVYGAALTLEAIGILVGAKSTYPRLPANQIVTG